MGSAPGGIRYNGPMSEEFRSVGRGDRLAWEEQARAEMVRLADEDLSEEPDEWEYDDSGNIRIVGTDIVVPRRERA